MGRNLIVLCDGTWKTAYDRHLSNIAKTFLDLAQHPQENQILYYHKGVGTGSFVHNGSDHLFEAAWKAVLNTYDVFMGGITGEGLDANILDAYHFLMHYFQEGDQIFLMGFSRGAYTVRSLAGLIRTVGLLKTANEDKIEHGLEIYRSKQGPDGPDAVTFRNQYSTMVSIHFLGVYETVGSLGLPDDIIDDSARYEFHDTCLSNIIKVARHALAVDEHREDFKPTIWTAFPDTDSEQRWFVGSHSDVGGGYIVDKIPCLSDISREWILKEACKFGLMLPTEYFQKAILKPDYKAPIHDSRYFLLGMPFRSGYIRPIGVTSNDELIDLSVELRETNDPRYRPVILSKNPVVTDLTEQVKVDNVMNNINLIQSEYEVV